MRDLSKEQNINPPLSPRYTAATVSASSVGLALLLIGALAGKISAFAWAAPFATLFALTGFLLLILPGLLHRLHVALQLSAPKEENNARSLGQKWKAFGWRGNLAAATVILLGVAAIFVGGFAPPLGTFIQLSANTVCMAAGIVVSVIGTIIYGVALILTVPKKTASAAVKHEIARDLRYFAAQAKKAGVGVFLLTLGVVVVSAIAMGVLRFIPLSFTALSFAGASGSAVLTTGLAALMLGTLLTYLTHVLQQSTVEKDTFFHPAKASWRTVFSNRPWHTRLWMALVLLAIIAVPTVGVVLFTKHALLLSLPALGVATLSILALPLLFTPAFIGFLNRRAKIGFALTGFYIGLLPTTIAATFGVHITHFTHLPMLNVFISAGIIGLSIGLIAFFAVKIAPKFSYWAQRYDLRDARFVEIMYEDAPSSSPAKSVMAPSAAVDEKKAAAEPDEKEKSEFSVFSLNMAAFDFGGFQTDFDKLEETETRLSLLPAYLRKLQEKKGEAFDCICLQEVSPQNAEIIRQDLKALGFTHFYFPDDKKSHSDTGSYDDPSYSTAVGSGLLIASRHPIQAAGFHAFKAGEHVEKLAGKGVAGVCIEKQGKRRMVYTTHLSGTAKGMLADAWKNGLRRTANIGGVEQEKTQLESTEVRDLQSGEAHQFIAQFTNVCGRDEITSEILVGDFNDDLGPQQKRDGISRKGQHATQLLFPQPMLDAQGRLGYEDRLVNEAGEIIKAPNRAALLGAQGYFGSNETNRTKGYREVRHRDTGAARRKGVDPDALSAVDKDSVYTGTDIDKDFLKMMRRNPNDLSVVATKEKSETTNGKTLDMGRMKSSTEICESQIVSTLVQLSGAEPTALSDHFGVFVNVRKNRLQDNAHASSHLHRHCE